MEKECKNFLAFHNKRPEVYQLFKYFALEALSRARGRRVSATLIYERVRFESLVSTNSEQEMRLPNQFRPAYARLFLAEFPSNKVNIETRPSVFDQINFKRLI